MDATASNRSHHRTPWNKGKLVGQKAPFKPKDIWAMRIQLQRQQRKRELALLNLAIDSKLRACDLVALKVRDILHGERVATRAIVLQSKTGRPVQFEITVRRAKRSRRGSGKRASRATTTCSRAGYTRPRTSAPASTRACCAAG